jgi:membrane-associated phospholipid phosphatase
VSAVAGTQRESSGADPSWVRSTWPVDRHQALRLSLALVAGIGIFSALGVVLVDLTAPNPITRADEEIAQWFVDGRTPLLDDISTWGAFLADTMTKIVVTAVFAFVALSVWRRWHEPVFVVITLVFEATVFIVVTVVVTRPRPDVPRLQDSPVDSSFPSGHVAAAVVYGAFVVVVFWHTASKLWRTVAVTLFVAVVAAVAWARLYQGMHYASDVGTGIVLGLVSLAVCRHVLGSPSRTPDRAHPAGAGAGDRGVAADRPPDPDTLNEHRVGTGRQHP